MKKYFVNLSALLPLALMLVAPLAASAHPGHDLMDLGPAHVVTSPFHLVTLALIGFVVWFAARFVKNRLPRRFVQAAGILAVASAAVIWFAHGH